MLKLVKKTRSVLGSLVGTRSFYTKIQTEKKTTITKKTRQCRIGNLDPYPAPSIFFWLWFLFLGVKFCRQTRASEFRQGHSKCFWRLPATHVACVRAGRYNPKWRNLSPSKLYLEIEGVISRDRDNFVIFWIFCWKILDRPSLNHETNPNPVSKQAAEGKHTKSCLFTMWILYDFGLGTVAVKSLRFF